MTDSGVTSTPTRQPVLELQGLRGHQTLSVLPAAPLRFREVGLRGTGLDRKCCLSYSVYNKTLVLAAVHSQIYGLYIY